MSTVSKPTEAPKTVMQKALDLVERVGNMVPHPVIIFLILIAIVVVVAHVMYLLGTSIPYQELNPETHELENRTATVNSLLTADGVRFIYAGLIPTFMGFTATGLIIVAMIGVGVAEEAGLVNALIKQLVLVSPAWALTYILAFVGI